MIWSSGDEAITYNDRERVTLLRRTKRFTDDGFNWVVRPSAQRPNTSDCIEFEVFEGNLLPVRPSGGGE